MKPRAPINGDLFGAPRAAARDATPVRVRLDVIAGSCTDKAWFLRAPYAGSKCAFVPRVVAIQDPRATEWFTLPKFEAVSRGWL